MEGNTTPKTFQFKLKNPSPGKLTEQKPLDVLLSKFGHCSFREHQWEIIHAIIEEKRDVCAVMATGSGKSLCYQFPSVYKGGVTIVISPLISLMEDQVLALMNSHIPACLLGTAQKDKQQTMDDILANKYRFVYLTPEFLTADDNTFLTKIDQQLTVDLIAVDEAHCISSWGHDYRFTYRKLDCIHNIFKNAPILAVTATATEKVRRDIITSLKLRNPLVICSGFDRPNFYFEVNLKGPAGIYADLKKNMIYKNCQWKFSGPTIIYCLTRKQTEVIEEILKSNGIRCLSYHAGLNLTLRKQIHLKFKKDEIEAIIATIAFGMGIDKPDVRNVIHYGCAKNIEQYYQEVGRASRDGLPASCVTFYNDSDLAWHRKMIDLSAYTSTATKLRSLNGLDTMIKFLETTVCRRKFILNYFEDNMKNETLQNCCDNCTKRHLNNGKSQQNLYEGILDDGTYDFTEDARKFLKSMEAMDNRFGMGTYVLFLKGSQSSKIFPKYKTHPFIGLGSDQSIEWWKAIGSLLLKQKLIAQRFTKTDTFTMPTLFVSPKGLEFLIENKKLLLTPPPDILKLLKPKPQASSGWLNTNSVTKSQAKHIQNSDNSNIASTSSAREIVVEDQDLYQKLLNKRNDLAASHDCMPYLVASNTALIQMSKLKPTTVSNLKDCKLDGFSEVKILKFAEPFLNVIKSSLRTEQVTETVKKKSIEEILRQNPLPNCVVGESARTTYLVLKGSLYPCSKNPPPGPQKIDVIAKKRMVSRDTIVSHLMSAIRAGLPVSVTELGVTEDYRRYIALVIQELGSDATSLRSIKDKCPDEITWDHIRAMKAYIEVRLHLKKLGIPYEEFEKFEFEDFVDGSEGTRDTLSMFIDISNKMLEEDDFDLIPELDDFDDDDPPNKKQKMDAVNFILDSPPRPNSQEIKIEKIETKTTSPTHKQPNDSLTIQSKASTKAKKNLPPWLKTKR